MLALAVPTLTNRLMYFLIRSDVLCGLFVRFSVWRLSSSKSGLKFKTCREQHGATSTSGVRENRARKATWSSTPAGFMGSWPDTWMC